MLILRRSRAARLVTWILGGLLICAAGPSLVLEPSPPPRPPGAPPTTEIERMLDEAVPAWATAAGWTGLIVAVVMLLTALILLGLPAANVYFRKPPGERTTATVARLNSSGRAGPAGLLQPAPRRCRVG